jgi:hypothetical protein
LWGERGVFGVAACPNDAEGIYIRINEAVGHLRAPNRRLARVISIVCRKVEEFKKNAQRSAKRTLKQRKKPAKFHKFDSEI